MSNMLPYAVFGATGRTGAAADALLRAGLPVRVVLRDPARGGPAARGVEIVQAELTDADALTRALTACAAPMSSARSSTGEPTCSNWPTGSP